MLPSWGTGPTGTGWPLSPRGVLRPLLPCDWKSCRQVTDVPALLAIRRVCLRAHCVRVRRDTTALRTDEWHVSCHRRRLGGRVTGTCLFPVPECKEVAEDGPQAEGCCVGCPWAGCLPFSGNSSTFHLWQTHRNSACFLFTRQLFTHLVNRQELAEVKKFM